MVLSYAYGPPSPPLVFPFFGGAVLAFALVGVLAVGGATAEFGGLPNRIQLWGTSTSSPWGWRWGRVVGVRLRA